MLSLNASGGRLVDRIRRLLGESPMKERRSTAWTIAAALALVTAIVLTPGRSVVDASELMAPLQPDARQIDYVRETQAALETLARETRGVAVRVEQASPQPQPAPQPAPPLQAPQRPQRTPQPPVQPRTQREAQPPQPPVPPTPTVAPLPPTPGTAPASPAPPSPPSSQVALPALPAPPAPPAPPVPPVDALGLDPDSIHELMNSARQQISESLDQLREATKDLGLKQEAIRQAQAEIANMRIESLASKAQIEAMQKALSELSAELSKLRAR